MLSLSGKHSIADVDGGCLCSHLCISICFHLEFGSIIIFLHLCTKIRQLIGMPRQKLWQFVLNFSIEEQFCMCYRLLLILVMAVIFDQFQILQSYTLILRYLLLCAFDGGYKHTYRDV